MNPNDIYIETKRLIIRALQIDDANEIYKNINNEQVSRWTANVPHPYTLENAHDFIEYSNIAIENDKKLASHILKIHKDHSIHFEIEAELLRKYIAYARRDIHPKLTDEAISILQEFYVGMRKGGAEDEDSPVPITARQLEALVRLSEAHARIRLSELVTYDDATRAINLQQKCLKQVGLDPETGKIDIDKVEGRTPKSDREKMRLIPQVIKELQDEYGDQAPKSIILTELKERLNMDEEKAESMLNQLRRAGVIYVPKQGYYKVV